MVGKWDPSAKEGRKMGGSCPASFLDDDDDDDDDDDASEVKVCVQNLNFFRSARCSQDATRLHERVFFSVQKQA